MQVEMPNGVVLEFPDTMSREDMEAAAQKYHAESMGGESKRDVVESLNATPEEKARLNDEMNQTKRILSQGALDAGSAIAGGAIDLASLIPQAAMRLPGAAIKYSSKLAGNEKGEALGEGMLNALPPWYSHTATMRSIGESLDPELLTPKTPEEKARSAGIQIAASAFSPNAYQKLGEKTVELGEKAAPFVPSLLKDAASKVAGKADELFPKAVPQWWLNRGITKVANLTNAPTQGAAQTLGAMGAGLGGYAGEEYFPDNPWIKAGLTIGGGLTPLAPQMLSYGIKKGVGAIADASKEKYLQNIKAEMPENYPGTVEDYIKNTPASQLPGQALSDVADSERHRGFLNFLASNPIAKLFGGEGVEGSGKAATKRFNERLQNFGANPNVEVTDVGSAVKAPLEQRLANQGAFTEGANAAEIGQGLGIDSNVGTARVGKAGVEGVSESVKAAKTAGELAESQAAKELANTQVDVTDTAKNIFGIAGRSNFEGVVASPLAQAAQKTPALAKSLELLESSKVVDPATGIASYKMDMPTFYRWKALVGEHLNGLQAQPGFGTGATKSTMGAIKEAETQLENLSSSIAERNKHFLEAGEVERGILNPLTKEPSQIGGEAKFLDKTLESSGGDIISAAKKEPTKFQAILNEVQTSSGKKEIINGAHTSLGGGEGQFNPFQWAKEYSALPTASKEALGNVEQNTAAAQRILERAARLEKTGKTIQPFIGGSGDTGARITEQFLKNPDSYSEVAKMLPADVQETVRTGAINHMGGGAKQFNVVDFAESYLNKEQVTDATRKLLANNDPKIMQQQRDVAQAILNRKNTVGFAGKKEVIPINIDNNLLQRALGIGGGTANALAMGYFSRMLTDPQALKIMVRMSKMTDNIKAPAAIPAINQLNQIIDKYQKEEKASKADTIEYHESEDTIGGGAAKDNRPRITITPPPRKVDGRNTGTIRGMIKSESAGNPNAKNPKSSASGILQYTDQTWADAVKNHPELKLSVKDKTNPRAQVAMTNALIEKEYKPALREANIKATPAAIYAMHHFGQGNAINFLTQKNGFKYAYKAFPKKVVKDNINVFFDENQKPRSNKMLYAWLNKRVSR